MGICSIENCNEKLLANKLCSKHYTQMRKYGKILERTKFDPNEFIIDGSICWIILYDKYNIEIARAKFLAIYYEQIKNSGLKWYLSDYGYVRAKWNDEENNIQQISLHEAIAQLSDIKVPNGHNIDHKDRNKLNCLDDNLRICTNPQNNQNRGKQNNNTSGHKGVSWNKRYKKWEAKIRVNGKPVHLGYYSIIEDAARAYNTAAIKYHGEFAVLNVI